MTKTHKNTGKTVRELMRSSDVYCNNCSGLYLGQNGTKSPHKITALWVTVPSSSHSSRGFWGLSRHRGSIQEVVFVLWLHKTHTKKHQYAFSNMKLLVFFLTFLTVVKNALLSGNLKKPIRLARTDELNNKLENSLNTLTFRGDTKNSAIVPLMQG